MAHADHADHADHGKERAQGLLALVPLFEPLDEAQVAALLERGQIRRADRREEIVRTGEKGDRLFLILDGRAEVLRESSDGAQAIIDLLGPGEVFGEIALLSGVPRTATVTAIDRCELLVLEGADVIRLLEGNPEVCIRFLRVLAERLHHSTEVIVDTIFLRLAARLAKRILALARQYGRPGPEGIRIDLRISQRELGAMVGTSRESINKQIRSWTREGILTLDRGQITVHRPDRLEALARALVA